MTDASADSITITKERYYELCCAEVRLELLDGGGVDNWEGYGDSLYPDNGAGYEDRCTEIRQEIFGEEADKWSTPHAATS